MSPIDYDFDLTFGSEELPILFDGEVFGYIRPELADNFVSTLRMFKTEAPQGCPFPTSAEVAYLPPSKVKSESGVSRHP